MRFKGTNRGRGDGAGARRVGGWGARPCGPRWWPGAARSHVSERRSPGATAGGRPAVGWVCAVGRPAHDMSNGQQWPEFSDFFAGGRVAKERCMTVRSRQRILLLVQVAHPCAYVYDSRSGFLEEMRPWHLVDCSSLAASTNEE